MSDHMQALTDAQSLIFKAMGQVIGDSLAFGILSSARAYLNRQREAAIGKSDFQTWENDTEDYAYDLMARE